MGDITPSPPQYWRIKWKMTWKREPYREIQILGVSQNEGCFFGGPHKKHVSILGYGLGSPYFGILSHIIQVEISGSLFVHAQK